jgi:pyruvate/2-oxoacid:ferredoxin oxidoreductase alpha subunit
MILVDGFFLSHTSDTVDVPDQKAVDRFLPAYEARYKISADEPHTFNIMADPSLFIAFKHEAQKAMEEAKRVVARVDREFKAHFGRGYGLIDKFRCQDAELILFTMGTAASTAREVIEDYRRQGKKVGLCRLRMFRPSPVEQVTKLLGGVKKVAVLDRDNSLGAGGIVAQELKAALYGAARKPKVYEFIAGLGGKDITPETIREVIEKTLRQQKSGGRPVWMGVQA